MNGKNNGMFPISLDLCPFVFYIDGGREGRLLDPNEPLGSAADMYIKSDV